MTQILSSAREEDTEESSDFPEELRPTKIGPRERLGSPGGPHIISSVANILMGVVDYGMDIQQAVNAPHFHHQWMPDQIEVEENFPLDTVSMLRKMGHKVQFGTIEIGEELPYWSDGQCIMVDPKSGERLGASDIRNNGKAVGY